MPEPTDLSALNPGERTALRLLAQGHTVKSIASETGRTLGSVNERLREARRKTGVGSSRELARLLAAQENRDENIGMAAAAAEVPAGDPEAATHGAGGRWIKGLLAMTLIALTAAAALSLLAPGTPPRVQNAATDSPFPGGPSPAELHTRVATEKRDAAWAPQAEAALRARYEAVPEIAKGLQVRCAATLCEIIASITVAPGVDENPVMQRLQTAPVTADLGAVGLTHAMAGFSGSALPFYAFWTRAGR